MTSSELDFDQWLSFRQTTRPRKEDERKDDNASGESESHPAEPRGHLELTLLPVRLSDKTDSQSPGDDIRETITCPPGI